MADLLQVVVPGFYGEAVAEHLLNLKTPNYPAATVLETQQGNRDDLLVTPVGVSAALDLHTDTAIVEAEVARDSALAFAIDALATGAEVKADLLSSKLVASAAAAAKVLTHNDDELAHPNLSDFITREANRAEAASDVAQLSVGIFDSTTLGQAGTTNGQYYSVPSTETSEYLILYKNNAGVPQEKKRYPSSDVVARLESGQFDKAGLQLVSLSVESGYLWALVDSNNRAAFLIDLSGAVVIPKFLRLDVAEQRLAELAGLGLSVDSSFKFKTLSPESGYIWALVDENDRIALAITLAGKVVGNFDLTASVGGYISSTKDLYYLGDSLTNGAGGQITWRQALADLISPRNHTNIAIGGQTSPQIVARAGAYVTLLTLASDTIPTSGPVAVVARTIGLLTSQGQQSIKGRLAGVYGTLARAGDDSYTFTRETAGAAVSVGKKLAFAPDIGTHGFDTWLIFIGANNIAAVDDIKLHITAAVAAMKPVDKRFLIMTPVTGAPSNATYCEQIEDWASQTYGGRVLKIREFSFQFNDGSVGDLADVAAGIIPRSLRIDAIHFTTFFHGKIAELVAAELNRRGW